jgi:hypothetical protein
MPTPTYADLYNAGMVALLSIVQGGKQEALFHGRKYTVLDLMELQKQVELFRRMAIQDGSLTATAGTSPVGVSSVWITDPTLIQ